MTSDRSPRVFHIITRLVVGGAQENTIHSCRGLKERGFDVTLVTGPEAGAEGSLLEEARAGGFRVIVLDSLRRDPRPIQDLRALYSLWTLFLREAPDIVHTHSSKAGILGRAAAWLAEVPLILHTNHGLPFHADQPLLVNQLWRLMEKIVAPATRKFLCVSEAMKRASVEARLAPAGRHEIVYSGMEIPTLKDQARQRTEVRRRYLINETAPVVGWVGRMAPQKGPRDFLKVLGYLLERMPAARALWVGDGPLRPAIETEVHSLPGWDRIHFTGRIAPSEIPGHLAAMDVLALTSFWEGLPRVAVQAALAGLPVVAYDVEGASEIVRSGETGYLVPVGDRRGLAERVAEVLSLPDRGRAMGAKGREFVRDRFDGRRMIEALVRVYGERR
ncbi:MAG TPA: glycosyltransferase family 4 protein [Planctomycetota bacterium]